MLAVGAELVHAQLAGLAVTRQPDLAAVRGTQLPVQHEVLAPWNGLSRDQVEPAVQATPADPALDRPGKPVTDPRQGAVAERRPGSTPTRRAATCNWSSRPMRTRTRRRRARRCAGRGATPISLAGSAARTTSCRRNARPEINVHRIARNCIQGSACSVRPQETCMEICPFCKNEVRDGATKGKTTPDAIFHSRKYRENVSCPAKLFSCEPIRRMACNSM